MFYERAKFVSHFSFALCFLRHSGAYEGRAKSWMVFCVSRDKWHPDVGNCRDR